MKTAALTQLEARLQDSLPTMTRKQRQIADVLLFQPHAIVFSSAQSLGEQAGVDGATVIRFCRLLGYQGLGDLKDRLAADVPHVLTAAEKIRRGLDSRKPDPGEEDSTALVYRQDMENIEKAAAINGVQRVAAAADLIDGADTVLVMAAGLSSGLAAIFAYLLRMIGIRSVVPESDVATMVEIAQLKRTDAVVSIGFWRYVTWQVRLFEETSAKTDRTVAITDSFASPLAKTAAITLVGPTEARDISNSFTAPMSIINALTTNLVQRRPNDALAQLTAVDDLYHKTKAIMES
jgi:DNA-binding MurR/RpiR family transcriptional regulator